jgi:hypothetical protein
MSSSLKNSKPQGLIAPANWQARVPSAGDVSLDFFTRHSTAMHGYVYANNQYVNAAGVTTALGSSYNTISSSASIILPVGPYNEISLQPSGTTGVVTVYGSMTQDFNKLVACVNTIGTDGFIRITALYKFIAIVATGLDSTSSLYIQIW